MTIELAVVGSPIQHSLSPVIHSAAYSYLGFDFSYGRHEILNGELGGFLGGSRISGVSVTMPLKYEAFELANGVEQNASKTGVVNTLVRQAGGWFGHNTDVSGLAQCFKQIHPVETVTILGSGATARSASLAISHVFPEAKVGVLGRSTKSVDETVALLKGFDVNAHASSASVATVTDVDLVVSTVPGFAFEELWGQVENERISSRGTLFDVAYDPWPSIASRSFGARSLSGLELLVRQAVEQVRVFAESNGLSVLAPDDELYNLMMAAIQNQSELN
jgi:shikimate dehydrogenase